jgi:thiol-disulfide isomerase/thioredoxin
MGYGFFLEIALKIKGLRAFIVGFLLVGLLSQHKCSRGGQFYESSANVLSAGDASVIPLKDGLWKFNLILKKSSLPFFCQYKSADSSFTIINATEKIICKPAIFKGDSVFFTTPVFQNLFCLKRQNNSTLTGEWRNISRGNNYRIKVEANISEEKPSIGMLPIRSGEKWEADFGTKGERYKAIGIFNYFEPATTINTIKTIPITGTFLTETGDFRYLEGTLVNNTLTLSCFDGSHAFLFTAEMNQTRDSIFKGEFFSGLHSEESWSAWRSEKAQLRNPDSLTTLKRGTNSIAFNCPNLEGKPVQYPSKQFENKVTIVSIMGSWCPNCMDETVFMQDLKNKYGSRGLEIVGLCFERTADFNKSVEAVTKLKSNLNANFEFLIAGVANNASVEKTLPSLQGFFSYPTTIFIDKKGVVRKIYTGFYGPSTGLYYNHYTEQTQNFIEKLMME